MSPMMKIFLQAPFAGRCIEPKAWIAAKGAREACGRKKVYYFETKEEMADFLLPMIKKGDILWLKASRGMKLEEVLSRLYEHF